MLGWDATHTLLSATSHCLSNQYGQRVPNAIASRIQAKCPYIHLLLKANQSDR